MICPPSFLPKLLLWQCVCMCVCARARVSPAERGRGWGILGGRYNGARESESNIENVSALFTSLLPWILVMCSSMLNFHWTPLYCKYLADISSWSRSAMLRLLQVLSLFGAAQNDSMRISNKHQEVRLWSWLLSPRRLCPECRRVMSPCCWLASYNRKNRNHRETLSPFFLFPLRELRAKLSGVE
jgi:hypothetical protein